ncbi:MAG: DUF3035 domain-containing protein [Rickettsiales bacterium]|nr:DUF3035 domain-containing protein [Rickettsiales bacterium]
MKNWPLFLAALFASGCSGSSVKDTLGLTRSAPDEYRVVSRPPLSVPPQFALRPPSATDTAPGQVPASAQAQSIITGSVSADTAVKPVTVGNAVAPKNGASIGAADSQFLQNAGASSANPHVREELVEERYQRMQEKEESSWLDALDWTKDKKDPMVDASKEAERIQKNEDEGKPVTEGKTPETKGRDTGLLGDIFGY